jgi:hypothetical protein
VSLSINEYVIWRPVSHLEYVIEDGVASQAFNKILLALLKIILKSENKEIFQRALLFHVFFSNNF